MKKSLIILTVLLSGCATSLSKQIASVNDQFESVVFDDGISLEEAQVIAKRALIKQNMIKIYDIEKPYLFRDAAELPNHERYWFMTFNERKYSNIAFIFMAIIDRETGKVIFADDYKEGKEWILEPVLRGS